MGIHDDPTGRRLELRRELDELRAAGEHASPRYCQLVREHAEARHAEDLIDRAHADEAAGGLGRYPMGDYYPERNPEAAARSETAQDAGIDRERLADAIAAANARYVVIENTPGYVSGDEEADEEPTYCQCGRPGRVRIAHETWLCLGCACDGLGIDREPDAAGLAARLEAAGAIIDGDPRGPRSARVCAAAAGLSAPDPWTASRWTSYFAAEWFAAVIHGASALLDELDGPPAGPLFGPSVPCAGCGIGGHPAMAGWRHAYYQGVGFALVCPQCAPDQTEAILAYRTGADRLLALLGLELPPAGDAGREER